VSNINQGLLELLITVRSVT